MLSLYRYQNLKNCFHRGFAVKTPLDTLKGVDLLSQRVSQVSATNGLQSRTPLEAPWSHQISAIKIVPVSVPPQKAEYGTHYYFGGLPALMQAVRRLDKDPSAHVIYVNDGQLSKTMQSGHQGHAHPSEWTAEECSTKNLFKALMRGAGLLREDDPSNLAHYSYLHFPLDVRHVLKNLYRYMHIYGGFFQQRIIHNLTAVNGVAHQDRWVCGVITESLDYHKRLSDRIEAETGKKTFSQQSRAYWSPNLEAIQKKERTWKELGIPCTFMTEDEIKRTTLLKAEAKLYALKIFKDGKFYPDTPQLIIDHLVRHYPNFVYRIAAVEEVAINEKTSAPLFVVEKDLHGNSTRTPVASLFGSPGHSDILRFDPSRLEWNKLWHEVPVSAISSLWHCEIDKNEMIERLGSPKLSDVELSKRVESLLAVANLSNLHVTTWDCTIKATTIELLARATQGANFNTTIANKLDLLNMANNLHHFFIGNWTLVSVGTCTRKTWVSNVPEFVRLDGESGFIHGLSGLGYSASALPPERLSYKKLLSQ